jgi:hypothetical protein
MHRGDFWAALVYPETGQGVSTRSPPRWRPSGVDPTGPGGGEKGVPRGLPPSKPLQLNPSCSKDLKLLERSVSEG